MRVSGDRQAGHVAAEAEQLGDCAQRATRRSGGARSSHFLQQRNDGFELGDVAVIAVAVGLDVARDFLARQPAAARQQIIAVAGQEIVGLAQHDLEAVPLELACRG